MDTKTIVVLLVGLALAFVHSAARAQQPKKTPRIGLLFDSSNSFTSPQIDALRQGLRKLGMWSVKTFPSSADTQKENSIGWLLLPVN